MSSTRTRGVGDFAAEEFRYDPIDPEQVALGANFRLETRLGPLDIMQWVAGIGEDPAYPALAREAITTSVPASCPRPTSRFRSRRSTTATSRARPDRA